MTMTMENDTHEKRSTGASLDEEEEATPKVDTPSEQAALDTRNDHHHHDNHDVSKHHHDVSKHHGDHGIEEFMALFTWPKQRQRWGDTQLLPHTNWGDIFFDLFYVAAAYNLGTVLREDPTAQGLLYVCGCFLPIMGLWHAKMYYDARFYFGDDTWHRCYELATLLALASAVLHIRPVTYMSDPNKIDMFAFSLSLLCGYLLVCGRYIEIVICHRFDTPGLYPEAANSARRDIVFQTGPTLLTLAATLYSAIQYYGNSDSDNADDYGDDHHFLAATEKVSSSDDVAIWLLLGATFAASTGYFIIICVLFNPRRGVDHKDFTVPMNIDYAIHRYGEWTMLMLGESVLSLMIVPLADSTDYYEVFLSGLVSIVLLQYLHFRSQPHEPDQHALRLSKNRGLIFSHLMQVYSIALVILGTSYKMFLYETLYASEDSDSRRMLMPSFERLLAGESAALRFDSEDRRQRIAYFFSGSMGLVWFCMDAMTLAHRGLDGNMQRCECERLQHKKVLVFVLLFLRGALTVFIATISLYETDPDTLALVGLGGIVVQLIFRAVFSFLFPSDEEEAEEEAIDRMIKYTSSRMHDETVHHD